MTTAPLADAEELLRRFNPGNARHVSALEDPTALVNQGGASLSYRMSSGALKPFEEEGGYPDHLTCSTYRTAVLEILGLPRESILEDLSWEIAATTAVEVRSIPAPSASDPFFDSVADPQDPGQEGGRPCYPAHSLILVRRELLGAISSKRQARMYSALARCFQILRATLDQSSGP